MQLTLSEALHDQTAPENEQRLCQWFFNLKTLITNLTQRASFVESRAETFSRVVYNL
jgi:hypothetical protein